MPLAPDPRSQAGNRGPARGRDYRVCKTRMINILLHHQPKLCNFVSDKQRDLLADIDKFVYNLFDPY